MPWTASMLTTAVAFVAVRYKSRVLQVKQDRFARVREVIGG